MSAAPVLRSDRLGTASRGFAGERGLRLAAVTVALAWAALPMAAAVYHTLRHGGVLTGTDSPLPGADQLFYMDSIRQSGTHVLIADHFDLALGGAVFLHPLYLLGGIVWRLGVPIQGAFWALSLLAAPALALGALALARSCLQGRGERMAAVAVGLFYMSPLVPLLAWTGAVGGYQRFLLEVPAGESMPAWQLWGYPHAAIAVGLLALALTGAASIAAGAPPSARRLAGIAGAAAIASWLHPWQGAIFIAVAVLLVARSRSWVLGRSLGVPVLAAAVAIAYEEILVHTDAAWRLDSVQNVAGHVPAWMLLVGLAPLVVPALAGVRAVAPGPWRTVLVAWPLIAIVIYVFSTEFPYHALEGIAIPLAVLAVAGWRELPRLVPRRKLPRLLPGRWLPRLLRRRWLPRLLRRRARLAGTLAALAALALTVPGAAYELTTLRDSQRTSAYSYWLPAGDRAALRYLEGIRGRGGVLARYEIGMAVPAFTGRRTWVGEFSWTPHFLARVVEAERLFQGRTGPDPARRFVASVGARYVLADCGARVDLPQLLGPLVASTARFGCAAVYTLRTRPAGPGR